MGSGLPEVRQLLCDLAKEGKQTPLALGVAHGSKLHIGGACDFSVHPHAFSREPPAQDHYCALHTMPGTWSISLNAEHACRRVQHGRVVSSVFCLLEVDTYILTSS